jgi:hypothetical protein
MDKSIKNITIGSCPAQFIIDGKNTWLVIEHSPEELIAFFMETANGGENKLKTYGEAYVARKIAHGRTVSYGELGKISLVRTTVEGWLYLYSIQNLITLNGCLEKENVSQVVEIGIKKHNPQYILSETVFPSRSVGSLYNFNLCKDVLRNSLLDVGATFPIKITESIGIKVGYLSVGHSFNLGYEVLVRFKDFGDGPTEVLDWLYHTYLPSLFQTPNGLLDLAELKVGFLQYNVAADKTTVAELPIRLQEKVCLFVNPETIVIQLVLSRIGK